MNVDVESVACLTDMHESSDPAVMKAARRLYEEWRLGDWAEQLNQEKATRRGLVPSSHGMIFLSVAFARDLSALASVCVCVSRGPLLGHSLASALGKPPRGSAGSQRHWSSVNGDEAQQNYK